METERKNDGYQHGGPFTGLEANRGLINAEEMEDEEMPPVTITDRECSFDVLLHEVDSQRSQRWNHIDNLDEFFRRVYYYHQHSGFLCILVKEIFELAHFLFIVTFSTFLIECVNYSVLFGDQLYFFPNVTSTLAAKDHKRVVSQASSSNRLPAYTEKTTIPDALLPASECLASPSIVLVTCLVVASVFWLLRLLRVIYHAWYYWEIRAFYQSALKISSSDLHNLSWHEVQRKLRDIQRELQMCIHKQELCELDIYQRILRFNNYLIAMINKSVLPVKFDIPVIGEVSFLTRGLKYNFEIILFWGPWSPFQNTYELRSCYKMSNKRQDLANNLAKRILWIALANFILSPLIFLWQILLSFFYYVELIKREPGTLGSRRWSLYSRIYLRHFNELEHELNARLNRAYKAASTYMNIFTSPLLTIIAKNIAFVSGAILAVLIVLTVIDEDVLAEHILTIMTVLGIVVTSCRVLIPDENQVWCPETLLRSVLAHVHYMPDHWKGKAHTNNVRMEFGNLFQYKAVYILEELLSPIITPFILFFYLRPKALEIVDFLRNFTVDVTGVGDICSFALMDVKRHGNNQWFPVSTRSSDFEPNYEDEELQNIDEAGPGPSHRQQVYVHSPAEDGKTELSLLHFSITNPQWKPSKVHDNKFLNTIREKAEEDVSNMHQATAAALPGVNPLLDSLYITDLSHGGGAMNNMTSFARLTPIGHQHLCGTGVTKHEGPTTAELTTAALTSEHHTTASHDSHKPVGLTSGGILRSMQLSNIDTSATAAAQMSIHSAIAGSTSVLGQLAPSHFTGAQALQMTDLNSIDMSLSTLYLHQLHYNRLRSMMGEAEVREMWRPVGTTEAQPSTSLLSGRTQRYGGVASTAQPPSV